MNHNLIERIGISGDVVDIDLAPIEEAPFAGRSWKMLVLPCLNPFCDCTYFKATFFDKEKPNDEVYLIEGVWEEESISNYRDNTGETETRISQFLDQNLNERDWHLLTEFWHEAKVSMIESYEGSPEFQYDFPVSYLNDPGSMIPFSEIFPHIPLPKIKTSTGDEWTVSDCYCFNSSCGCTNCSISLYNAEKRSILSVWLDYSRMKVTPFEIDRNISDWIIGQNKELVEILRTQAADLSAMMQKRHGVVKKLHLDFITRNPKYDTYKQRLLERLAPSTKKVSRNEPCPCGSGKKYKRCCGA